MASLDATRTVERPLFFNGQRLFAEDLQGLEAINREMRYLHNRSLHQPGIGNGFAVQGKRGDRVVTIGPGYAIDINGCEIVLTEGRQEPVPPVAGELDGSPVIYDLVVSCSPDEYLEVSETRVGVCLPGGATRLREEPLFCWVRYKRTEAGKDVAVDGRLGAEIESGLRIVLARVEVLNCQLRKDISLAERRNARPARGPHIACDILAPDPWQTYWLLDQPDLVQMLATFFEEMIPAAPPPNVLFFLNVPVNFATFGDRISNLSESVSLLFFVSAFGPLVLPLGIQAEVDTRSACFRSAPSYFTRLSGSRVVSLDLVSLAEFVGLIDLKVLASTPGSEEVIKALQLIRPWRMFVEGLPTVVDPQAAKFTFQAPVMVQLLEVPVLRQLQAVLGTEILSAHIQAQFEKHPLVKMIQECAGLTGKDRQECLEKAAREALGMIEDVFIEFLVPSDWELVWMGIEE